MSILLDEIKALRARIAQLEDELRNVREAHPMRHLTPAEQRILRKAMLRSSYPRSEHER